MGNIHNGPKRAKNYDNDILELIFLTVQLDKDLLRIQNDFYKFWHHSLQVINKWKNDTIFLHFLFSIFFMKTQV